MLVLLVLLGCLFIGSYSAKNNTCPTFQDYYTVRQNPNCWYNPIAELNAPATIKFFGYPLIEYKVLTKDGYILTMYRIPSLNPRAKHYPVYVQHGLVASSHYFLGLGKNSLPFVLADAGYDVWLGNYRGAPYSEGHVNLTVYDNDYWEHSMDEVVRYDFPALFDTILKHTDPHGKILYVGHSLGTTLAMMYGAEFPEIANRTLRVMVFMSPAYTLTHMKSPYAKAAPFGTAIIPGIIRLNGYPLIEYKVPTQDGYILKMFRIPSDNVRNPNAKNHPVYLQHGLVATCANFLAFVLADAGYDVWLGNYRGTQYSEGHVNITVYDQKFWEHSMDEVVNYDLPALFRTILAHSEPNSKIIFIGHSLGSTLALMYGAEYPEIAGKIMKLFLFMSPAYTLSNIKSPYKMGVPYGHAVVNIVRNLEMFRIVSQAEPLGRLTRTFCLESPPLMQFCLQLYNLFYGPNTQMGPPKTVENFRFQEIIPVYFNQLPGGTALRILNHAADLVLGNFRKYNFVDKNFEIYGQWEPPIYDIKKLQVPVYLFYSTQDWATTEEDTLNLWWHLPEHARYGLKKIDVPKFNHIDFVFGRHARTLVYDDLVKACEIPTAQNEHSHYLCDDDGEVKCLPGWTGDLCDVPKCRPGCDPLQGYCNRPGECLCKLGYYGEKCNKCIPLPGCQHGYCNRYVPKLVIRKEATVENQANMQSCVNGNCTRPWECNCKKGWGGMLCDEELNYCENNPDTCKNGAKCISLIKEE
ncbi:uncharacterized protein BDFB_003922, partial [Asbolus verrucosus]